MKALAVYSIKGGVGKTALAVNLAYEASRCGLRTLLIDLDPQGACGFYLRVRPTGGSKPAKLVRDPVRLLKAVHESDYPGLDILPARMSFRNFDLVLSRSAKRRQRLRRMLSPLSERYDLVLLDCPPNITLLSENVFAAADLIVTPVVPTTLSERTLEQFLAFYHTSGNALHRVIPVFSMVEIRKSLHRETMAVLRERTPPFLTTVIPYCTEIERMGLTREPLLATGRATRGGKAYRAVYREIGERLEET